MNSLPQIADVVIGVDTHVATHSAAAVHARTGGVLAEVTAEATAAEGYEALVQFADEHPGPRAWAIEGTGGHGAGLARHLAPAASSSSSPAGLSEPGAATARSPTRSTRSAPPA